MKNIKQRTIVKDIKRLNRNPRLMGRARNTIDRVNRQTDNDKKSSQSPVEYAQHRSIEAAKEMIRAQMGISVRINNRLIRLIQKKRILSDTETVMQQDVGDTQTEPSVTPNTRLTRRLRLRKPTDRRYLLSSRSHLGKQRFIQSRVRARLLRSRTDSFPSQMNRDDGHSKPAGKKESSAAVPRYASGRTNRYITQTPERLERRHFRKPFPYIPSAISQKTGYSIKRKERNFKTLAPIIKMGQQFGQGENRSDAQTEGKANAIKEIQRAVQMAVSTRRSIQTAKAAARLNLFIIRMVVRAAALLVKGLTAVMGVSGSIIAILCIVMAIASVISSPFGIFVSGENTDADVKPLSRIVQEMDDEFAARLIEIQKSAGNVDRVEFHYPGSADNTRIDNWEDIIAVFAVKTVMDEESGMDVVTLDATRFEIIRSVFWDMNPIKSSVETIEHRETVTVVHEDGRSTSEETTTRYEHILHITIASKTAEQQAGIYQFTNEQRDLMKEMLSTEFRPLMFAILGKDMDYGLTPEQLGIVRNRLPEGTLGSDAVKFALTRLGDPYSQPKAGQDHYTDCSYLVQWVYRQLGVNLPRTAAEQAKYCVENGITVSAAELIPGDLVFWSYERNGRFMDITHVGIYAGGGKVVDASSSRGQVVYRNLFDSDKQVLYGRPNY